MTKETWEKFLDPKKLKGNLVSIALFITFFEMFKAQLIEKPKYFFMKGFEDGKLIVDRNYETEVVTLDKKNILSAALLWLKKQGAIDDGIISDFYRIREHRNSLVHEMISFLSSPKEVDSDLFESLITIFIEFEKWWIVWFESSVNPELFPEEIDIDQIVPGVAFGITMMLNIALGKESDQGNYLDYYKQYKAKSR
jgi:hypothetical protein